MQERASGEPEKKEHRSEAPSTEQRNEPRIEQPHAEAKRRPTPTLNDDNPLIHRGMD